MAVIQDGKFKKKTPFVSVSLIALDDDDLSNQAKGVYSMIQRYITLENFTLYKSFLIKKSKNGFRSFNTTWNELKEHGYLKQYRIRTDKGFEYEYVLLDEPDTSTPSTINVKMDGTVSTPEEKKKAFIKQNLDIEYEEDTEPKKEKKQKSFDNSIEKVTAKIKQQINYEYWKAQDNPYIDNILNTMLDVYFSKSTSIKIGKEKKSINLVKSQFSKITQSDIESIILSIDEYIEQGNSIINPLAFLTTALYNAPLAANINIKQYYGLSPGSTRDNIELWE